MQISQQESWQGKVLGRYRLLRLLGRGGMGEVWLAEDTQLRRQVAVKLLPTVLASDHTYRQAFEHEARAAAALEHPHILSVHDFGTQQMENGQIVTYLVIPYIADGSLRERIQNVNGPLPPDEALHYLRQAAQAIDYAHSQHVLHRDIKPANMLLQQSWLFLADFGIAKLLDSSTQRNQTHSGAGTPEYMAPEQVQGKAEPASDRYSLAIIAYLLACGQLPFRGETPYSILIKQMQAEPPSPRLFNPALSPQVEQVLLWGLAKEPQRRPATCQAFVDTLTQSVQQPQLPLLLQVPQADPEATLLAPWNKKWQAQAQAQAQALPHTPNPLPSTQAAPTYMPSTPLTPTHDSTAKKTGRRTFLISGAIATAAILATGGGAAYYVSHLHTATSITQNHGNVAPIRGPQKLIPGEPILSLTGHSKWVWDAAWDKTGRYLATGSEDTYIMLWDIASYTQKSSSSIQSIATPMHQWKLANSIYDNALSWSPDGQTIASVIGDNHIYLFDVFGGKDTPQIYQNAQASTSGLPPTYNYLAWSPIANTFVTTSALSVQQGQIQTDLWQVNHLDGPLKTFSYSDSHTTSTLASIDALSWSADGKRVAGLTNFGEAVIWEGTTVQVLTLPSRLQANTMILKQCIAWSPFDPHLLAISDNDIAIVWDTRQKQALLTLKPDGAFPYVTALSWAPNGKYIVGSFGHSKSIFIWDVETTGTSATQGSVRTPLYSFPKAGAAGHTATIVDVEWSPNGRYIASASADATVIVWKVDAG